MKIRRKDALETEVVSSNANGAGTTRAKTVSEQQQEASDSVKLSLAKNLGASLDPSKLAGDRRQRIEELKGLIQAGKYNPKTEDIARAVGGEIAMEIMTSGGIFSDQEEN